MHRRPFLLTAAGILVGSFFAPSVATAAVNYFDTTKTVSGSGYGTVSCPSGWKMTGGGSGTLPENRYSSTSSDEYYFTGSYPTSNGWKATATKVHGTYSSSSGWRFSSSSYSVTVYAICVS